MSTTDATSVTDWRDDDATLEGIGKLNAVYEHLPFSREYEGVLDEPPLLLDWSIARDVPVAWKGGVAGVFGDELALAGGMWMPDRLNIAYSYDTSEGSYTEIPPVPYETQYTQGACDASGMYVVGGRACGRRVSKLTRLADGAWTWGEMPSLPLAEDVGRWLAGSAQADGRWLFLVAGNPTGKQSEVREAGQLPDYKLRLDPLASEWETMASYPGGPRALVTAGSARGALYVFGGSHTDPAMRHLAMTLPKECGVRVPYGGVPNYRDAYRYDPDMDEWTRLRNLPFPMLHGDAVTIEDRFILLMGSADVRSERRGKRTGVDQWTWVGYGDMIVCYDVDLDNYSRVGVMPYGVATAPWVLHGDRIYGAGGEPAHGLNANTENVLQVATIRRT